MQEVIRVAVDAMGGDNAPGEIVKGAIEAVNTEIYRLYWLDSRRLLLKN